MLVPYLPYEERGVEVGEVNGVGKRWTWNILSPNCDA